MRLSIIGGGNLGSSLIQGILQTKRWKSTDVLVCDIDKSKISSLKRKFKIRTTSKVKEVLNFSSILVLAVKPKDMEDLLSRLHVSQRKLFITVAAGIATRFLEKRLGKIPVIRVMPNICVAVGEGVCVYSLGRYTHPSDEKRFLSLFAPLGEVIKMKESFLDVVTAISGGGPAYVFRIIEILAALAEKDGLTKKMASRIASQTVFGSAKMAKESSVSPESLRAKVTSPGGTTEAALEALEKG
ncbi:MAG: pyrroline-5-carboxylate reductase, partial [Candidatus Omnitrophica bacterium]|nr:pyrroline-5-carboxylate reductase [Candidatus Omnitrophota bacterium]